MEFKKGVFLLLLISISLASFVAAESIGPAPMIQPRSATVPNAPSQSYLIPICCRQCIRMYNLVPNVSLDLSCLSLNQGYNLPYQYEWRCANFFNSSSSTIAQCTAALNDTLGEGGGQGYVIHTVSQGSDKQNITSGLRDERRNLTLALQEDRKNFTQDLHSINLLRAEEIRLWAWSMGNVSKLWESLNNTQKQDILDRINLRLNTSFTLDSIGNGTIRAEIRDSLHLAIKQDLSDVKQDAQAVRDDLHGIIKLQELIQGQQGKLLVDGSNITFQNLNKSRKDLIAGRIDAKFNLSLSAEDIAGNISHLLATLSNGRNATVKLMPDRASAIALKRLSALCNTTNCDVELKEVGQGNTARLAYNVQTQKDSKLFFLINKKMTVSAQVDAETGQVISTHKPWWSFLASESKVSNQEIDNQVSGN